MEIKIRIQNLLAKYGTWAEEQELKQIEQSIWFFSFPIILKANLRAFKGDTKMVLIYTFYEKSKQIRRKSEFKEQELDEGVTWD